MTERLKQQIGFIIEIDKMKSVLRQTLLCDGSRRENDAEHSWHLAMMAIILQEYAARPVDLSRVLRMTLTHDLIEIYAGDTFAYDAEGNKDKERREKLAADKLFAQLPAEQGAEFRVLWEEFDEAKTPDAAFATALDRLQPLFSNYMTKGHTWHLTNPPVSKAQVYARNAPVKENAPELWRVVEEIVRDSVSKGYLE